MPKCIVCQREIKEGVIGKKCAEKLDGPSQSNALAMVRLLNRLKNTEGRELSIKVDYDFKNSIATCIPLVHSPNMEQRQKEFIEQVKYYMEAHLVYSSPKEKQIQLAQSEEKKRLAKG